MIKAVIFDLDDTLISEKDYIISGFKEISTRIGQDFDINIEDIYEKMLVLFSKSPKNVFNRTLSSFYIKYNDRYINELINLYRNHEPNISFFEDTISTIKYLREGGYKLGIITDGYKETQNRKLDKLNCRHLFDSIIITDELGREFWKPDERSYILMAKNLDIKLEEMVYMGDNLAKDFVTANRLGIITIGVFRSEGIYHPFCYNSNYSPRYKVSNIKSLIEYLK